MMVEEQVREPVWAQAEAAPAIGGAPRYGVVVSSLTLPRWQAECLRLLAAEAGVPPAVLLLDDAPPHGASGLLEVYRRLGRHRSSGLRPVDCRDLLADVPTRRAEDLDAEEVDELRLDFVLDLGRGSLPDELGKGPRLGVWRFRHGDPEHPGGDPPGLWEVHDQRMVTGAVLETSDAVVLRRGWFPTAYRSWRRNQDRLLLESAPWPARVCRDLMNGGAPYFLDAPSTERAEIRPHPTALDLLTMTWRVGRTFLSRRLASVLRTEHWRVGVIHRPIADLLALDGDVDIEWLPDVLPHHYLADPFGVVEGDRITVLCEIFDRRLDRGSIAAMSREGDGPWSLRTVLASDSHLSYPFLIHHDGGYWMVPENAAAGEIALYRALEFPDRWEKAAVLVEDFPGSDATLFQHEGRWWMLATDGGKGAVHELYAWYADELLGPWTPHPMNPVKVDVRSSRGAGTPFVRGGRLYRPTQDCSERYGGAVTVNEVVALTPTTFREEPVRSLTPPASHPRGVHTISACGDLTLVDAQRMRLVPSHLARTFTRFVRSLLPETP